LCEDASDCEGFCGGSTNAACQVDQGRKLCECRPPCKRDQDCMKGDFCNALSLNRNGGAMLPLQPYCDAAQQRCNCRDPNP